MNRLTEEVLRTIRQSLGDRGTEHLLEVRASQYGSVITIRDGVESCGFDIDCIEPDLLSIEFEFQHGMVTEYEVRQPDELKHTAARLGRWIGAAIDGDVAYRSYQIRGVTLYAELDFGGDIAVTSGLRFLARFGDVHERRLAPYS
jgi:hypothetical protein